MRAAVILLHATQENYLRQLLLLKFHNAPASFFDGVKLLEDKEKFMLVELARHRGTTVDAVLADSLAAHLERTTFNNVGDLKNTIALLSVDPKSLRADWKTLGEMMDRRHAIVHRGDMTKASGRGKHFADSISPYSVGIWIEAFTALVAELNAKL